jgi:hypothetical protein
VLKEKTRFKDLRLERRNKSGILRLKKKELELKT